MISIWYNAFFKLLGFSWSAEPKEPEFPFPVRLHIWAETPLGHLKHYGKRRSGRWLKQIHPSHNDACKHCKLSPADHAKMSWTGPRLTNVWSDIFAPRHKFRTESPWPLSLVSLQLKIHQGLCCMLARRTTVLMETFVFTDSPPSDTRVQLESMRFSQKGSTHISKSYRCSRWCRGSAEDQEVKVPPILWSSCLPFEPFAAWG